MRLAHGFAKLRGEFQLRRDVGRVLDDLERFAFRIENRVVARLDPHLTPAFGDALVLSGVVFAERKLCPQRAVLGASALAGFDEHPVMLAAKLLQRIPHEAQEVGIGSADRAVEVEFDDGLRLADGGELALPVRLNEHLLCDIHRVLDDFEGPAAQVENGEVRRLDPDGSAVLGHALVLGGLGFSPAQFVPEGAVLRGIPDSGIDEIPVMHASQVRTGIARGLREVLVGREHVAVEVELDDRQPAADRLDLAPHIGQVAGTHPRTAQQQAAELERIPSHG